MSQDKIVLDLSEATTKNGAVLNIPGYVVKCVGGQVRVYKDIEPPKTFSECCDFLGIDEETALADTPKVYKKLGTLQLLLICRNAWWKYLNYEPNFTIDDDKYVIEVVENDIDVECYAVTHRLLAFPTEKIAKSFLTTFTNFIHECAELI